MENIEYRGYLLEVRALGSGWRVFIRRGALIEVKIPHTSKIDERQKVIDEARAEVDRLLSSN